MKFTFETDDANIASKVAAFMASVDTTVTTAASAPTTVTTAASAPTTVTTAASAASAPTTAASAPTTAASAPTTAASTAISIEDFKSAAKKAKRTHGEEFSLKVLEANGHNVTTTLGRECGKVEPELYETIMAQWDDGPKAVETVEEVEELDEEVLQEVSTIDPNTVKSKLRDYARENGRDAAKAVLEKAGLKTLGEIDGAAGSSLKTILDNIGGGADEEDLDDF